MSPVDTISVVLRDQGWFSHPGAYVLVDGQFGSTGKGALAVILAMAGAGKINVVTTNAGPNSGHIGYRRSPIGHVKVKTQQIPVSVPVLQSLGYDPICYLNGGAVIDPAILEAEIAEFNIRRLQMLVHPTAAVIEDIDRATEAGGDVAKVASTGKGVGAAIARKVLRTDNTANRLLSRDNLQVKPIEWDWDHDVVFVETAQGFSLGLNEHRFHPFTTSRECTVGQVISDARIPPQMVRKVILSLRTYPIRVGNTSAGESGGCYEDQHEISWESIGQTPEKTTVTGRIRRLFTWSRIQFREAVAANRPDVLFLNFLNYLSEDEQGPFKAQIMEDYYRVMGRRPEALLMGYGPYPDDVKIRVTQ